MTNIRYCGTWSDYSGYGQANRTFITALFLAGVNVGTELVVQVPERATFGWTGELCKHLQNKTDPYKIKIIHLTPDLYPKFMEKGKYHIGHLFWETDQLPKDWIAPCNKMNEIWTASEAQAQMIRDSGVKVPIYAFPQPIDVTYADRTIEPFAIPNFTGFTFYAIFQWIERKNPKVLLQAFWKAFSGKNDIGLVIKTYGFNYSEGQFNLLEDQIRSWKAELNLPHYPRVFLCEELLKTHDMFRLHATGDCYICTTRGEGWGIPVVESMLMGKPVVGIDKTGIFDYVPKDYYYPCSTALAQVIEVPQIPWYTQEQRWLEVSEKELIKQMKYVVENRNESVQKGSNAKRYVKENFNYWMVGEKMKERLLEIERTL